MLTVVEINSSWLFSLHPRHVYHFTDCLRLSYSWSGTLTGSPEGRPSYWKSEIDRTARGSETLRDYCVSCARSVGVFARRHRAGNQGCHVVIISETQIKGIFWGPSLSPLRTDKWLYTQKF